LPCDDDAQVTDIAPASRDVSDSRTIGPAPIESADLFRLIAASSPIGILLFDTEGRVTFVNDHWREAMGIGADEPLSGFDWIHYIHPDDREQVLAEARRASEAGGTVNLEFRYVDRDGEPRWNRTRGAPVRDPDGTVTGFVATVEDITAEHKAGEAQRRLTQALETTPDFIVILEADGRVLYANEAVRQLATIHGHLDVGGLVSPDFFTPESWQTILHEAWPALCEKGEWQGELCALGPDGTGVPLIQSARAHRNAEGRVEYISAIARDISELKRFEEQLAESEARFRALVERSHDLVSLFDAEGRFVYLSPSHARVLGYEPSDLLGCRAIDLIHPDDRQRSATAFADQLLGDAPTEPIEHRQRHRDGSYRWIEAVAQNRLGDPGVRGIVVNARDVTERKRAEQLAADEARILERVARGVPLAETLAAVVAMVEQVLDDCTGAVITRDESSLQVLVAPGLDPDTIRAVETESLPPPNPTPDEVIVRDIEDPAIPNSEGRRTLLADGFHTVWATPLRSSATGDVLGGLLVLRRDRQSPSPGDHRLLALAGNVAAIAIARDREVTRLARAARRDPLTSLPNRTEAIDRLAAISRPEAEMTAVLFLDLDRFKLLNDNHGHAAGDRVLIEIGRRLRAATRPGDLVARLGGDEFVVVCEHLSEPDEAVDIANRVLRVVREPIEIDGRAVVVKASIGIAAGCGENPESVLRDADAAMYLAKDRGRDRVEVFV
jgi:diguanylate cyclase (GGDEF)-like protein/PAS domain S-box-containing protein